MYEGKKIIVRVHAIGPGHLCSISGKVKPSTFKKGTDALLLNTQHYNVR